MAATIFGSAFSHISPAIVDQYSIEDIELLEMVTEEFYDSLNNPQITGPRSMLDSLGKDEGQEDQAEIEAANRELRIQNYIMIEEMRQLFGGDE